MLGKTIAFIAVATIAASSLTAAAQGKRDDPYGSRTQTRGIYTKLKYDIALLHRDGSVFAWGSWNSDEWDKLRESKDERLYVKKDGKGYFISDQKTIDGVMKAAKPVMELGRQQGELGKKQGELGRQQGELGMKQGELGRLQGDLWREHTDGDRKDYERKSKQYSEEMRALGEKQKALGDKQRALGEQQRKLGEKQREASKKANEEMTRILDAAFEKGLARTAS